jgi:hypothetical protein
MEAQEQAQKIGEFWQAIKNDKLYDSKGGYNV